jgi:pimeloyl-ACP methyl ester carboxylesterase
LSSNLFAQHPGWEGYWEGKLVAGDIRLGIAFHISRDDTGGYRALLDVPKQGIRRLPVSRTKVTGTRIMMSMDDLDATFSGRLYDYTEDDPKRPLSVDGFWRQNGQEIRTQLLKGTPPPPPSRPQTPQPPFPYASTPVRFPAQGQAFELAGTLTAPHEKPKAALILVTGSGAQDRDETILDHKPFAVLADHLSRQGYVVLRYDDRGTAQSGGTFGGATTHDFTQDAAAALAYLRQHPAAQGLPCGVLGHSEGGMVAAMLAAQASPPDFSILLAGPGTSGKAVLVDQNRAILLNQGIPKQAVDAYLTLFEDLIAIAETEGADLDKAQTHALLRFADWRKAQSPKTLKALHPVLPQEGAELVVMQLNKAFCDPWMRQFFREDPATYLRGTTLPTLALFGGTDLQVRPEANAEPMRRLLLHPAKHPLTAVQVLPGHNHLFQKAPLKMGLRYGDIPQTMSPEALAAVLQWLDKVAARP